MRNVENTPAILIMSMALFLIGTLMACSSINTHKHANTYSSVADKSSYQVRVRSGNLTLDRIIHEAATKEFSKYLKISADSSATGFIDITFLCKAKKGIRGSAPGYIKNVVYGNSWYTGNKTAHNSTRGGASILDKNAAGMFKIHTSNMKIHISKKDGLQLWAAQDAYSGLRDFTLIFEQSVEEAALLSLNRIISQFKNDFTIQGTLSEMRKLSTPPDAALVIKRKKPLKPRMIIPGRINIKKEKSYLDF